MKEYYIKKIRAMGWWGVVLLILAFSHSLICAYGMEWLPNIGSYLSYGLGVTLTGAIFCVCFKVSSKKEAK